MSDNFDQRELIHKKIHRLLEAFVYDYLRKSGAHEAAKNYYKEARLYDWPPPWLSSERIFPTTFTNAQESNQAYQTYTTTTNVNTSQVVDAGSSQTYISPPIFTPDQVSEWNVENQEGNSISGITVNDNTKLLFITISTLIPFATTRPIPYFTHYQMNMMNGTITSIKKVTWTILYNSRVILIRN